MADVERKHREEALALTASGDSDLQTLRDGSCIRHWLKTGAWVGSSWPMLDRIAAALAQRDARIGGLESALAALKPPGTVAVELGHWQALNEKIEEHMTIPILRKHEDDTLHLKDMFNNPHCDFAVAPHVKDGKRYTATLLLAPVGE